MKAPLAHEPAIPTSSTIVVPIMGLDALGLPLDEKHVYGAEIIHNATGHPLGQPVTTRLMAAVLINPQLGLKSVPSQARVALLLNQVTPTLLPQAYEIAAFALTDQNVERVLIGAVQEADPIREIKRRVGAIVLAAGASRRMGKPKLLLPWGPSTIIRSVCERVVASGLHEVVVIAGEQMEAIQQQLSDLPVQIVYNPDHAEGEMLSSLKLGLQSIWHSSSACMVVLGDQPEISQDTFSLVVNAYGKGLGRIIVPTYKEQRGHPVLIDSAFWPSIIDLPPGGLPRDMLSTHEQYIYRLEVDTESVLSDIDTPNDYKRTKPQSGSLNAE
jgi:molybdenum cofactor cytidylyltransferase